MVRFAGIYKRQTDNKSWGIDAVFDSISITCPHCWEPIEVPVEPDPGDHEVVEDCSVCCRPILMHIVVGTDGELLQVERCRENE